MSETTILLPKSKHCESSSPLKLGNNGGLSVFFTILCIVDLFGVFPVITLPKVIIVCGLYGIPIIIFVFTLQIYTAILLGRCWSMAEQINPMIISKNRYPYAALAEMTFGPSMSNFVTLLLDSTVFGGSIPNLLVAAQNLQLIGLKMTDYRFDFSFCWWLIIIGFLLCPIMWIGSPKDMKLLAITSVLIVCSVTFIICYCILTDSDPPESAKKISQIPSLENVLVAYGIIAFQFDIHPMLLTIQVDMKNSSMIGTAVLGGYLVTGGLFTLVSILASYKYGGDVESNILQGLPGSISLYLVVLLVTLQLCLSSAVGNSALFQHIEDKLGISRDFNLKRCISRALIVMFAVILGETVPRFDLVMGLIGSTLTGPLMFIFPPLFYCRIVALRNQTLDSSHNIFFINGCVSYKLICLFIKQRLGILLAFFIICFGLLATCIATYYSWSDAIKYAQYSPPCLINITAASLFAQIGTL